MAKRVRLKGSEFRKWTANAPVVLAGDGSPGREATAGERRAILELTRHAQVRGTSASARAPGGESTVRVEVKQVPVPGRPDLRTKVAEITIDGCQITDSHSVMRAELLAEHGECQVLMPNGKFMMMLRDPSVVRGTAKDSLRNAPRPEHCQCRDWGDPHPGRHHRVCEHNAKAPPEERGDDGAGDAIRVSEEEVRVIETLRRQRVGQPTAPALPAVPAHVVPQGAVARQKPDAYSPEECPNNCRRWAEYKGNGETHHAICQYAEPWEARNKPRSVLMSLDSGEVLRAATLQEIGEAEANEERTGGKIVVVAGEQFVVASEEDARKLQEERGGQLGSSAAGQPEERDTEPPAVDPADGEEEEDEPEDPDAPVQIQEDPTL